MLCSLPDMHACVRECVPFCCCCILFLLHSFYRRKEHVSCFGLVTLLVCLVRAAIGAIRFKDQTFSAIRIKHQTFSPNALRSRIKPFQPNASIRIKDQTFSANARIEIEIKHFQTMLCCPVPCKRPGNVRSIRASVRTISYCRIPAPCRSLLICRCKQGSLRRLTSKRRF